MATPLDESRDTAGRVIGWVSGLGLLIVPWIAAGVLATAGTMVRQDDWDAERTFPRLLLLAFVAGLGWIAYGCLRIPGFRRGTVPAAAIALGVGGGVYLLTMLIDR